MDSARVLIVRLFRSVGSILLVVALVFLSLRVVPGDPAVLILGEHATDQDLERFRAAAMLDRPLGAQALHYARDIFGGTFGKPFSPYFSTSTVAALIFDRLPYTIELALAALLVATMIAFPAGIMAALYPGSLFDRAALGFSLVGVAIPTFWFGPMLLYLFAVVFNLLPGPAEPITGIPHLILPALTLGLGLSGKLLRFVRAGVLETRAEDYVLVAQSKGLGGINFVVRHILPGALVPVITLMGVQFASLLGGTIIVEQVFARPGIGRLLMEAVLARDYNVVQGCVLTIATAYVVVHTIVDFLYAYVDPRVRVRA